MTPTGQIPSTSTSLQFVEKKIKACTNCKKRKTKCDGSRPTCGSCLRSHRNAARVLRLEDPPLPPICTYIDQEPSSTSLLSRARGKGAEFDSPQGHRSCPLEGKVYALEERLATLEALLTASTLVSSRAPSPSPSQSHLQISACGQKAVIRQWTPPSSLSQQAIQPFPHDVTLDTFPSSDPSETSTRRTTPLGQGISDELLVLLWPSWPPHLPSPALMDHIADVFFSVVPGGAQLLNRARFRHRLTLPPTHEDFPHPALLHAICALSARYTAAVYSTPAEEKLDYICHLNVEQPLPTSDGLGPLQPGDEDFASIHSRWATKYFQSSLSNPKTWVSLVTCGVLMSEYCYGNAKWIEGWNWVGQASRLAIPLGLNDHQLTDRPGKVFRPTILSPPADDIERVERQNLWWKLFLHDVTSSHTSGWAGSLSSYDMSVGLPICSSSSAYESGVPEPKEFISTPNLFSTHQSPHDNPYGLTGKGCLLMKEVNDHVRRVEALGIRGGALAQMKSLDLLVQLFELS